MSDKCPTCGSDLPTRWQTVYDYVHGDHVGKFANVDLGDPHDAMCQRPGCSQGFKDKKTMRRQERRVLMTVCWNCFVNGEPVA